MRRATRIGAAPPSGGSALSRGDYGLSRALGRVVVRLGGRRVARRVHNSSHALFFRPCGRCNEAFEYCGHCSPGRCYCGDACSATARLESKHRARTKYNARDTAEGREAHRIEEAERRARRGQRRVGDHRCHDGTGVVGGSALAATQAAAETLDDAVEPPISPPALDAVEPVNNLQKRPGCVFEWVLVAWPELLAAARLRQGTCAVCPFCGRRGRIVGVISLDDWRRKFRYSFA